MDPTPATDEPTPDDQPMVLDTCGLNCPLPILRTKKALRTLAAGAQLKVISTDPGSVDDFKAFAEQSGHALLSIEEGAEQFIFVLEK